MCPNLLLGLMYCQYYIVSLWSLLQYGRPMSQELASGRSEDSMWLLYVEPEVHVDDCNKTEGACMLDRLTLWSGCKACRTVKDNAYPLH